MDEVTLARKVYRMGEEKPLTVIARDHAGADISGGTCVIDIWDESGTQKVTAASVAQTGTTRLVLSYTLTTGSGKTLTAAGNYRALFLHTLGGVKRRVQVPIEVLAAPS